MQLSLENTIKNLNHVSHQLSHQGMTGKRLYEYILSSEPYDRLKLISEVLLNLTLSHLLTLTLGWSCIILKMMIIICLKIIA